MKIEIIRQCRVDGKEYAPGDIVETDRNTAQDRIGLGRAKMYVAPVIEPTPVTVTPPDVTGGNSPRSYRKKQKEENEDA